MTESTNIVSVPCGRYVKHVNPICGGGGSQSTSDGVIIAPGPTPPTLNNSGEAVANGDVWFNETTGLIYVKTANSWIPISDHPAVAVGAVPPQYTNNSDPSSPNKRYPIREGDLWLDTDQLALYVAATNVDGDIVWIIATPNDRSAVTDQVNTFVTPAAADGETTINPVTGIKYVYNAAKKQWIDVGTGPSPEVRDLTMQLRGRFELNANGEAILPEGVVVDTDELDYDDIPDGTNVNLMKPGVYWLDPTVANLSYDKYNPLTVTHLMIFGYRYADIWDSNFNEIYTEATIAPEFEVGDIIRVTARGVDLYQDPGWADTYVIKFDDVWRVKKKIPISDDNNVSLGWYLEEAYAYEVEKCVPDRQYSQAFWGFSDLSWVPATVNRWFETATGEDRKRSFDNVMQVRGKFELDPTGTYAITPPDLVVEDSDGNQIARPSIYFLDPTTTSNRYNPKTLTHLAIHGSRYLNVTNENGVWVYDESYISPTFEEGDLIHVNARGIEFYTDPIDQWVESYNQQMNDIWRVKKKFNVQDDNNLYPNWGFYNFYAYELEKVLPDRQYGDGWTLHNSTEDVDAVFAVVKRWFEPLEIQEEVFGYEENYNTSVSGRLQASVQTFTGLVDAGVKKAVFHPTENFCAFNKDNIPSGYRQWQEVLAPYPQTIFLKFANGNEYYMTVEYIGYAGTNQRSKNFAIVDRGNFPLNDLSAIDGIEFNIYKDYRPTRISLQGQIDALEARIAALENAP